MAPYFRWHLSLPLAGRWSIVSKDIRGRSFKAVKWEANVISIFLSLTRPYCQPCVTTQVRRSNYFQPHWLPARLIASQKKVMMGWPNRLLHYSLFILPSSLAPLGKQQNIIYVRDWYIRDEGSVFNEGVSVAMVEVLRNFMSADGGKQKPATKDVSVGRLGQRHYSVCLL